MPTSHVVATDYCRVPRSRVSCVPFQRCASVLPDAWRLSRTSRRLPEQLILTTSRGGTLAPNLNFRCCCTVPLSSTPTRRRLRVDHIPGFSNQAGMTAARRRRANEDGELARSVQNPHRPHAIQVPRGSPIQRPPLSPNIFVPSSMSPITFVLLTFATTRPACRRSIVRFGSSPPPRTAIPFCAWLRLGKGS